MSHGNSRPEIPEVSRPEETKEPILLKNGIALLSPRPIARGAFGKVYVGRIVNPVGLLAERIVWGEESPRWLGLEDIPYEEPRREGGSPRLPSPILDRAARVRVYEATTRLWEEYCRRRKEDPVRAEEEFKDWLHLLDPLLLGDSKVAVKVFQPSRKEEAEGDGAPITDPVRRFIRENDLLRELNHPGIVRRFGLVFDPKLGWCLLLEYIEGDTLDRHLGAHEGRRMPVETAVRLIRGLAEAVGYMHGQGIVHRDLKPQNIMVRADTGAAVIMDFGIGKWADAARGDHLTLVGMTLGTPRYMAPEQARPEAAVTAAADVYQLATLLFEMVTGHAAYEGMEQDEILKHLRDPLLGHPAYAQDHLPSISQELEALIEVGRDKDPAGRWTIGELQDRLELIVTEGRYERRRLRKTADRGALAAALSQARMRKKEASWKERLLEMRLQSLDLEVRLDDASRRVSDGALLEARSALEGLARVLHPLPRHYDPLKRRLQELEQTLRLMLLRQEAELILGQAEADYQGGKYRQLAARLAEVAVKLEAIPRKAPSELHERHKKLSRHFDAHHRSSVELFETLRGSFVAKIRAGYHELHERYGEHRPLPSRRIEDLLKQLGTAETNLKTLDPRKVGPADYEEVVRELQEQRIALEDLSRRAASAGAKDRSRRPSS